MTIYSDTPEEFSQKSFVQNFCKNISSRSNNHRQIIRETELSELKAIFASHLSALLQKKIGFLINNLRKITARRVLNNSDSLNLPPNFAHADKSLLSNFDVN